MWKIYFKIYIFTVENSLKSNLHKKISAKMKSRGKICKTHFSGVNLGVADIRLPGEPICYIFPTELGFPQKCVLLQICLYKIQNGADIWYPVDQNPVCSTKICHVLKMGSNLVDISENVPIWRGAADLRLAAEANLLLFGRGTPSPLTSDTTSRSGAGFREVD